LTSHFYGTGAEAEAFNRAFAVPETMSIVIAGGALATGFVPTFAALLQRGEDDRARHTFRALLTLLCGGVGIFTLAFIALTLYAVSSIFWCRRIRPPICISGFCACFCWRSGFSLSAEFSAALSIRCVISGCPRCNRCVSTWESWRSVGGARRDNLGIEWQAWGAVVGALIGSVLLQVPAAWRAGLSIRPVFDWKDEGVQKVLRALVPVFFGLASGRILALQFPVMAGGEATVITNASRLAILPLELIASGSAIALFPTLAALAARGETEEVRQKLSSMIRQTLKRLLVAMILLMVLAFPLVKLLFEHGEFSGSDARLTAQVLMLCALALPALGVPTTAGARILRAGRQPNACRRRAVGNGAFRRFSCWSQSAQLGHTGRNGRLGCRGFASGADALARAGTQTGETVKPIRQR
jgi:putative peptidoglycan lipid II flippase